MGTAGQAGASAVFETLKDLVIAPPNLIAAKTGQGGTTAGTLTDVWDDLRFPGSALRCFTSQPRPTPGDALYLGFGSSLAGTVLSLRIGATSPAGIGIYPSRPPLTWEAWSGEAWVTVPVYSDTTGGLNRDGDVVLLLPLAHEALALGNTKAFWIRVVMTRTAPGEPNYQASPEIRSVVAAALGGTTVAEHSVSYGPRAWAARAACPASRSRFGTRPSCHAAARNASAFRSKTSWRTGRKSTISLTPAPRTATSCWTGPRAPFTSGPVSATQMAAGGSKGQPPRPALRSK